MSHILIKTFGCACGYQQDFEPTEEATKKHFTKNFEVKNLQPGECPSCALKGLRGQMLVHVTEATKKMRMEFFTEAEAAQRHADIESEPEQEVDDGMEFVEEQVNGKKVIRQKPAKRMETTQERTERLEKAKAAIKHLTAVQIAELKAKHEDA